VVKSWRERHPRLFRRLELHRQENKGVTHTLNQLLRISKGEYVSPLASDDYLLRGGIEARVRALQQHPLWLGVFGDCLVVDEDSKILSNSGVCEFYKGPARKDALLDQKLIGVELAMRWSVPGPVFMMRKNTCEIVGYYDESMLMEDRDFYLRLLSINALGFIDYKVACYRWHRTNVVKEPSLNPLMSDSFLIAAAKGSRLSKGLLKYVLLVEFQKRKNGRLKSAKGMTRVKGILLEYALRFTLKMLRIAHDARYYWRRYQNN
jgi:glycosyltransferase involved in cell wall biosynthesis